MLNMVVHKVITGLSRFNY